MRDSYRSPPPRVFTPPAVCLFLLLLLPLSGCSILFVAKGGTHYKGGSSEEIPAAKSLSREMARDVVEYHTQKGDSLPLLSQAYYGDKAHAEKIALYNHLDVNLKLRPKMVLRIPNPLYFPNPSDIKRNPPPSAPKKTAAGSPVPSPTANPLVGKITKLPRPKVNRAFAPGERLRFEVRVLSMLGGYATLEVGNYTRVAGRPCLPLSARTNSTMPLTTFYPVGDVQTSYMDAVDFLTWKFQNNIHEGNYRSQNMEIYDQLRHRMTRKHNQDALLEMDVAPYTQDIISCFYYFRLLPIDLGKTYSVPTQSTGKNYQLIVKAMRRETVTVPAGTFDCFVMKPIIQEETIFRNKGDIDLWVTADSRHIPVKAQSGIVIGHVDVDLLEANLPPLGH